MSSTDLRVTWVDRQIRFRWWHFRAWRDCKCMDCGRHYEDWAAGHAEWDDVMDGGSGMICMDCFIVRAGTRVPPIYLILREFVCSNE